MKKIFMLFAFISLVGSASVSAQVCCSKSKAECTAAATKAASASADIEKRISEESGKVTFVRKSICEVSGKTSYTNVEFDAKTKKFVNVSPTHTSGKAAAAGNSDDAKATSVSKKGKGCCKKGKSSCTKKSASTTAVTKTAPAKAVNVSND